MSFSQQGQVPADSLNQNGMVPANKESTTQFSLNDSSRQQENLQEVLMWFTGWGC